MKPSLYINRELSWLEFNYRVLEEALDKTNPILERFKFLAITASNMDEFFMVRVAGLTEQYYASRNKPDPAGLTPKQQLDAISDAAHELMMQQYNCLNRQLIPQLEQNGIKFVDYDHLTNEESDYVKTYFKTTLFPIITPMAIDQSRPFPLIAGKSLNFIVEIGGKSEESYAFVQVPGVVSRIFKLPSGDRCILLEEIIRRHIGKLFKGYEVLSAHCFRIIRNADLDFDEEDAHDLLSEIEESVKQRKRGQPVRLEVEKDISKKSFEFLKKELPAEDMSIYRANGPLDLTYCFGVSGFDAAPELSDPPMPPIPRPEFEDRNIFDVIREGDLLLHHPYDSFDSVVNLVKEAAADPNVLAIKQTLYRVSGNSPIINALIQAAENGKQVTVLVELKARFDEENNIIWARKLEKAGCHVIYGLVGLKTHCKLCLVVRQEEDGIRRYVHLGTGNYNDKTAKTYTDLGLMTAKESYGKDISALFNVLTGYSREQGWGRIAVAPTGLRAMFSAAIKRETENAKKGRPAKIVAKMNSLVDVEIIDLLYKASQAGVKITLIIRGICCLRSGIKGVSDNITVISIVGRFLEHSRIYYFENAGEPVIRLSSADWMPRNLDRRVEVAFEVTDENLRNRIKDILQTTLKDTIKARIQQPETLRYKRMDKRGKELVQSQNAFYEEAKKYYTDFKKQKTKDVFIPVFGKEEQ
ncbi:MAG: RNA degradosome polyphosphate kinase [Firmicutes bacterium]|nr:RNA degradosome polyphosphate kinase [Bacillota bacterium]